MNIVDVNSWSNILDEMVLIGGSARSGTTIMGKLINSLDKTEYLFEPPMLTSLLLKKDELSSQSLKELIQFYFFDNFLLDALAGRNLNLNTNDDSCILHVKNMEDIKSRQQKSFTRVELEGVVLSTIFSFKLPEIVFFLDTIDTHFPRNKKILMHRNPNDVINSIIRKKWFSSEYLDEKHPSQIYATEIINSIKIPYWVKQEDKEFWTISNELNRCAYYYRRISEEILENSDSAIIINYEEFVKKPNEIFKDVVKLLGLEFGEKTEEILSTVQYQDKHREDYLEGLDGELLSAIKNLDEKLKALSF